MQYIGTHSRAKTDLYTLAVIANLAFDYSKNLASTRRAMQALIDSRPEHGDQISCITEATGVYSTVRSSEVASPCVLATTTTE